MTTFYEAQSLRDAQRAINIANGQVWFPEGGDECRRWSLCDRCKFESPEMRTLHQQIAWEDDHTCFGCDATSDLWNADPVEAEDPIFPYPELCTFTRKLEELPAVIHVRERVDLGFTSTRTPQAARKAA